MKTKFDKLCEFYSGVADFETTQEVAAELADPNSELGLFMRKVRATSHFVPKAHAKGVEHGVIPAIQTAPALGMIVEVQITSSQANGFTVASISNNFQGILPYFEIANGVFDVKKPLASQKIRCMIINCIGHDHINLSQKVLTDLESQLASLGENDRSSIEEKWLDLQIGQICQGVVLRAESYGFILDLRGSIGWVPLMGATLEWQSRILRLQSDTDGLGETVEVTIRGFLPETKVVLCVMCGSFAYPPPPVQAPPGPISKKMPPTLGEP